MTLETFFEKFDQFAEAPGAVAHLRDIVYSVGLASEKWPHESLESVAIKVTDGTHQTPRYVETGIPFVSVKDFSGGSLDMSATRFITPEEHNEIYKRCDPKLGDILLGRIGTIGKAVVIDTDVEFSLFVSAAQIRPDREKILSRYLQYVLNSPFCRAQFDNIKVGGATHTNKLNLKDLRSVKVPLPPLAEQKRIVAKVDELMALCDRLEAQQQERETRHAALARASLARFANAPTPANLNLLFHSSFPISPSDLRKSILTLAVQGKLAPQDPNDEPTEVIFSRVEAGQNQESVTPVDEAEVPWSLPSCWQWVRLGAIANIKHGYAFGSESFTSEPTPYVLTTPGNFYESGGFRDRGANTKYFNGDVPSAFIFNPRDLIIPMTEQAAGLLGSPAFIPDDGKTYLHNQRLGKLELYSNEVAPEYLFWFFNSEFFRSELARTCTGMKVRHTSPKRILKVPFALPPLAEQRRIVAKVSELMALVDDLEQQLAASRATAEKLLTAFVAELTATS